MGFFLMGKKNVLLKFLLFTFILFSTVLFTTVIPSFMSNNYVDMVHAGKARYSPGDAATISVDVSNTSGSSWMGAIYLFNKHN